MADLKSIVLKDVELRWAFLSAPQTKGEYASNKYQVDVLMDEKTMKQVKELINSRQKIKKVDDKYSITLKSSRQPKVVGSDKHVLSSDDLKNIGNGTVAHVKANQYQGYKDQVFLGLRSIMIKNLVEYNGGDDFAEFDDDSDISSSDDDELI